MKLKLISDIKMSVLGYSISLRLVGLEKYYQQFDRNDKLTGQNEKHWEFKMLVSQIDFTVDKMGREQKLS